mgnify:CR=1 FL=1
MTVCWCTCSLLPALCRMRKAIVAATVVFLAGHPQTQIVTVLAVLVVALVAHVIVAPYEDHKMDRFETLALLIQASTMVLAQVRRLLPV